ncbi:MAG TPA: sulfite exporter TauE/SafE family protein [Gaiellaceae bacterium]|nr:sulfite exporter TauE/SafE family protein [Gaiellaceae bacterium]
MSVETLLLAIALGFLAGALSGMFGVGGGVLFVPTLAFVVGLGQLAAQATSLAAIIPVVAVGAWQQHRAGNTRVREGVIIGVTAIVGVLGGAKLATSLPEDLLRDLFAGLLLVVAAQLAWSARGSLRRQGSPSGRPGR